MRIVSIFVAVICLDKDASNFSSSRYENLYKEITTFSKTNYSLVSRIKYPYHPIKKLLFIVQII